MPDDQSPPVRTKWITIRVHEASFATIDGVRGAWSRGEYIRQAVAYAIKRGFNGPKKESTL